MARAGWSVGRVFLFLGLVVVAVLVYAVFRPGIVRIQRAVVMDAPAEKIFGLINDLHCWKAWAPQDKGDPGMVRTFSRNLSQLGRRGMKFVRIGSCELFSRVAVV